MEVRASLWKRRVTGMLHPMGDVYDAVQVFAKALTDLDRSQDVQPVSIDCTGRETWQHGNSLVNYMKLVR